MNDPRDHQPTPAASSERPEPPARPEASPLARHGDPSTRQNTAARKTATSGRYGGVEWVRVSELLARAGGRAAGRGADSHEQVVRRMRRGMASINPVSRRGVVRRSASSLPPVSVFGQTAPAQSVARGAVAR